MIKRAGGELILGVVVILFRWVGRRKEMFGSVGRR